MVLSFIVSFISISVSGCSYHDQPVAASAVRYILLRGGDGGKPREPILLNKIGFVRQAHPMFEQNKDFSFFSAE
jgi:hypothetical protein